MKPDDKMESEETDSEPSLDKMLDLDDPKTLKALGGVVQWKREQDQKKASDRTE